MIRVCFHGAESAGKSVLAQRLSAECGWLWVPEFGRSYCEEYGTDLAMDDLLAIAAGQDAAMRAAAAKLPEVLLLDTDPLMTAAWAQMLFGGVPPALLEYEQADLYLLFAADTPWVPDGTRFFGGAEQRQRFAGIAEAMLVRAGANYQAVSGDWETREAQVRAAITSLLQ
jgi:NadR type nicotinamide-nucleotide adenylyltransferase